MENFIEIGLLVAILLLVVDNWRHSRHKSSHQGSRRVLLDTSVIIDGRILELAKTGFINDELVVPRSVLSELQLLADGNNSDKRARARFGMDVITKLQKVDKVTVTIFPDDRHTPEGVDNRLLRLAKEKGFALATIDYNLNKIAVVEGVTVLNINELARVIRMQILPGEKTSLKLVQEGQGKDQAIGYLEDGAMVVVANAKAMIGKTVDVEISRSLQTDAGKMIFAEIVKPEKMLQSDFKTSKKVEQKEGSTSRPSLMKKSSKKSAETYRNLSRQNKGNLKTKSKRQTKVARPKNRQDEYLDRIINTTSSK